MRSSAMPKKPFGSSTPSSKIPIKPNSEEEARRRRGGRPPGHEGAGRTSFSEDEADGVEDLAPDERVCPHCHCELLDTAVRDRSYIEIEPIKPKKKLVHIHRRICPGCMKTFERKPTDVLPRVQIGNRLGAQCLYDHYVGGMTLGALARRLGLKRGSLASFEKVAANLLEKTIDRLTEEYRSARVKHADETTWRCDGRNGYAWGFFTDDLSIYRFRESRGSKVAVDVFGEGPHKGVLVVDRYAGYNPAWLGRMQYCFEHLKRDGKDILEKGVKDEKERALLEELVECLRFAMTLRRRETGKACDRESRRIQGQTSPTSSSPRSRTRKSASQRRSTEPAGRPSLPGGMRNARADCKGLSAAAAWLRGRAKWVSRVRPIRTSTAVGLSPQPETAAEGSVSSRHIVETLCRARFRIVETERQPRSDPALH